MEGFPEKKTEFSFRKADATKRQEDDVYIVRQEAEFADAPVKHQERRVDALALRADERRDKLRKATGRCK